MNAGAAPVGPRVDTADALLDVRDLTVAFHGRGRPVVANRHVSLRVAPAETLGVVGESGSGKSVLCRAMLRLLPTPPAHVTARSIRFDGTELTRATEAQMRRIRGTAVGMVFQNPMTSLSAVWPIGDQVTEGLRIHRGLSRGEARGRGIELFQRIGIPDAARRYDDYPYQWSGGMLQRAVIAMAMACGPRLLLADEPTTALDVTIQAQILALLAELQAASGMALVLVSHDIAVIAETCDRIVVMYAGIVVEQGAVRDVFANPKHPYTLGLMRSSPSMETQSARLQPIPGQPPDLSEAGVGCPFAPRCALPTDACRDEPVALREVAPGHASACRYPERVA